MFDGSFASTLWNYLKAGVRAVNSVRALAWMFIVFMLHNWENISALVDAMPVWVGRGLDLLQKLLDIGGSALAWSMPPAVTEKLAFANTVLPLSELFQVLTGLAGLYMVAVMIRILKALIPIIWH